MAITAQQVKELRDITNAGMMDCKKALEAADGNMDNALKILKEKGLADAKKRSDRETKEGGVYISEKNAKVAIALIACETDFVANNDNFKKACNDLTTKVIDVGSDVIDDYKTDLVAVGQITKENIEIKKLKLFSLSSNQYASTYIHGNNKNGVVVVFESSDSGVFASADFKEMAKNVALHTSASAPLYLSSSDVPENEVNEQKQLFEKQMEGSDKKPEIIANIMAGKIAKFKADISLLEQKYIKDDKLTVAKYVEESAKKIGANIKIKSFVRFSIGA